MAWRLDGYEGRPSKELSFNGGANHFPFSSRNPRVDFEKIGKKIKDYEGEISEIYKASNLYFCKLQHENKEEECWTLTQNGKIIRDDAHRYKVIAELTDPTIYTVFCVNDFDGGRVIAVVMKYQEEEMENFLKIIPSLRICDYRFTRIENLFKNERLEDKDFKYQRVVYTSQKEKCV